MSFLDDLQKGVGTVTDVIQQGAATYDRLFGDDDPFAYEGNKAGGPPEPPRTVGVQTTQAQPANNTPMLLIAAVVAIVLLKVL